MPIQITGAATPGVDFVSLPSSITFAAGVSSVPITVTPLHNSGRTNSTTVTVTLQAGGGYTLGAPASASVTIYPSGVANGTGLSAAYFTGSNASYTNGQALGAPTPTATYAFTQTNANNGSAVITYVGVPAIPFAVGSPVILTFTSGNLNVSGSIYNGSYAIGAVGTNSITVPLASTGVALPASGSGNVTLLPFAAPTYASNFGGIGVSPNAVTYSFNKTSRTALISYTGTPAVAYAPGGAAAIQFTSGNLYTGVPGVFDITYAILSSPAPTFNASGSGSGTFTVAIPGTTLPATGTGNATISSFFAPVLTRIDPTVDFIWGTQEPTNTSLQTATNNNWAARWS